MISQSWSEGKVEEGTIVDTYLCLGADLCEAIEHHKVLTKNKKAVFMVLCCDDVDNNEDFIQAAAYLANGSLNQPFVDVLVRCLYTMTSMITLPEKPIWKPGD